MTLEPRLISKADATRLGVMPGWWAVTPDGTPAGGPYATEEAAIVGIGARGADQPTGRPGEAGPPPEE
ncbi:hypothetical protein GGQ86_002363 [Xanthobacter flavus]|uniref:Uncharacterized protein n=2 Tax=Xanthobacter flavus TaxID=281 RepID=A0ABU1KGD4_XANFL|nr:MULTISPECIES: hypothetical protein [Xanthobacter]MDR6333893.1 hypothetical protein [Xanthobacter flavus]NMN60703.1 hypothetical protein [Xanthobacter sp. SG618]